MSPHLVFTPQRRLLFESVDGAILDIELQALKLSLEKDTCDGLIMLADHPHLRKISPPFSYWHDFAEAFMRQVAISSDGDGVVIEDLTHDVCASWFDRRPPMQGAEYIDVEVLATLWTQLKQNWHARVEAAALSPREYLQKHHPLWADVGRVYFHLAENPKDPARPFAFLATYSVRVSERARIQHRPLGLALKDSIENGNTENLIKLLRPIEKAAKTSAFVSTALETKELYRPIFLDPKAVHKLLNETEDFEDAGIICKLPDFWQQKRPPRAQVSVTVGAKKKSNVGLDGLMDFDVTVAVGDQRLSKAEIEALLRSTEPLVQLGGKWVEVDQAKLQTLMDRWEAAARLSATDGIPLGRALRLLAGFTLQDDGALGGGTLDDALREWMDVKCGAHLSKILETLRAPGEHLDTKVQKILNNELQATLRPYQFAGIQWLHSLYSLGLGGCLADDMGLGKTLQVIALMLLLKKLPSSSNSPLPNLLVVPSSLVGNWRAEIKKFAPQLTYKIIHPALSDSEDAKNALKIKPERFDADLYITTYSMLSRIKWMTEVQWNCVIVDEAQAIKNSGTRQSQTVRNLQAQVCFAMTGTPVENNLGDLWSIFDFTCRGLLGSVTKFKEVVAHLEAEDPPNYTPLRTLISPYLLRRRKTDKTVIADLPDKIEVNDYCDLSIKQAKLYQRHVDILAAKLEEAEGIGRHGLVLSSLMKLKQICNHPSQYEGDSRYSPEESGKFVKLKELAEVIASKREKLIVFTQYREIIDVLQHFLSDIFGRSGLVLHGNTPVKQRQALVDDFQDEQGPPFFVLSLKAGGTGLNLTRAQHVVHFDRWWNPAVENQATDRAFRIGQKNHVMVHKFISQGTIEERIDQMIQEKRQLADSLIEGGAEINLTRLSNDEILSLVRLDLSSIGL